MSPQEAVTRQLWDAFIKATEAHPRGLFLRVGDDGARMRCLMAVLGEVLTPMVLEIQELRERVSELSD